MRPSNELITVVLADDHDLVRSGIKALLSSLPQVAVIGEARNGDELLATVLRTQPDVVVTDISMPGTDGLTAATQLRARHPKLGILMLSMYDTVDFVRRAIANGANGYMMKDADPRELEHALRMVASGGAYFDSRVARMLAQRDDDAEALTERQIEILKLMAEGLSAKEIGFKLGLSSKTVDAHRARIMERLEINDIASLTRYALRKGLVKA